MQKIKIAVQVRNKPGGPCCPSGGDGSCGPSSNQGPCCPAEKKDLPPWAAGTVSTPAGPVLKVTTEWSRPDFWGMVRSRIGAFRMNYAVPPGLYAVGTPAQDSDVLVTANYKLTFDTLRRELGRMNAWILVLDTKGINVWCAAGKGIFCAEELVRRIRGARLDAVVSHRRIILPQLGAVGVNAASVQKQTGFRVSFGPVRARDIGAYIEAGYTKTQEMSTATFPLAERLILTPMEINPAMKKFPWIAAGILLVFGLEPSGILFKEALAGGMPFLLLTLLAVLGGAFVTPILLPVLPFRSFALKGLLVGLVSVIAAMRYFGPTKVQDAFLLVSALLLFPALTSYLALQFTGATTFTGMSGVKKELRIGIPLYLGATGISLVLMIVFKLREWGLL